MSAYFLIILANGKHSDLKIEILWQPPLPFNIALALCEQAYAL